MLLHLAIAQLWREKHNPEFRIMALALFLAVFSVTILTNLTAAFRQTMGQDAATLLGADLIVESSEPLSLDYIAYAQSLNLQTCTAIDFFSMISVNGALQLASIYAIDTRFPLRGQLVVKTANSVKQFGPPPPGEIWMEESLASKLNVQLNEKVTIGDAEFVLGGIIQQRPVALSDSSALAAVAYVNAQDLTKMAVLQPGSRATYRLLLEGSSEQIRLMRENFQGHSTDVSWVSPSTGRAGFNRILTTANQYLAVILLIQSLLAGFAVAICANQYSIRQQKNVALIRCFGASSKMIFQLQITALIILAFIIFILSISAGYVVTHALLPLAQQQGLSLSVPFWQGGIFGALSGVLILIGFALGPILDLQRVSPIQILQQRSQSPSKASLVCYILAVVALGLLFTTTQGDGTLAIRMGTQILGLSIIAFALSYGLWFILSHLSTIGPLSWRFGMAYLVRYKWKSITQWLVFTIVIMLLLLVQIIQGSFIKTWQEQLPIATPNYFLLNIQPNQVSDLEKWFKARAIEKVLFYPIVRGRMSHINGLNIDTINKNKDNQERKGLGRPINLTWMSELPSDNKVIAGIDWSTVAKGQALISIEKNFAERQGVSIGDSIGFQIGERSVSGKVVQVRTVEWESFKPNFFVIFPPNVIDEYPHSYITSFYLQPNHKEILVSLAKEYVEISIIDIDALLQKVRQMIDKVSLSLQVLLMMVFVLGLLIMYASLLSSLKERLQESALLQILGANRRFIAKVLCIEFCVLGLMAGLFASVIAQVVAFDLAKNYFGFSYTFDFKWLFIGIFSSAIIILVFGLMGARKVFYVTPLSILRQTG